MQIDVDDIFIYNDFNNVKFSNINNDANNFSVYDKLIENNEIVNIVKKLQEVAKKYY